MSDFKTLEGITELFKEADFIGEENCFFYSLIHIKASGGFVAGMEAAVANQGWSGYLINQTEKGIGMIPIKNTKVFTAKPENMEVHTDQFKFISQENIKSVKIKRQNLISAVAKTVIITLNDTTKYELDVRNKEPKIPYHAENFKKFVAKYKG